MKKKADSKRLLKLKNDRSNLQRLGIDLEYFPCYINRTKHFHSVDVILLSYIISGSAVHYIDDDVYQESGGRWE